MLFLIQCLRDAWPCYRLRRQPSCILPCLHLELTLLLSCYTKMFVLICNKCDVHPLRCVVINVNLCIGRTMSEAWQPKRLPVPAPNFSALLLANINHRDRLLQRLNVKHMPQNCSAHQCEYPLPTQRPPCHMWRLRKTQTEIIAWSYSEPQASDWNWVSRIGSSLAETETWKSPHLWSGVLLLTCWFKRFQNVLTIYLNHMQTESEAKRRIIILMILNPWSLPTIDMMIKFSSYNHVTRPPFRKQLHLWSDHGQVSSSKVDSYTTTDMIHKSIHWLDQLLQDVHNPGWERDQRDEFQSNDDHVAMATLNSSNS